MSPLNMIVNLINNLALSLLAFMLHSTRIVFLFLLLWAFKEGLLTLVPRVFRLMIRLLLLPGDLLHSLAHVVAARLLGYAVDVRLAISTGSAERSLLISSGDHIKTRHAMFIALYPLILNGAVLMMLGLSSGFFLSIERFDLFLIQLPGSLLYAWLFVSIFFYLPPDLGDWMFIYHVLIDRFPYILYGCLWGGLVWILGSVWIGYIPTTLIISIYLVVVYYTLGRETVERLDVRDPAKKLLEEHGLPPDLADVLIYDNSQGPT
ncbi:MAG: hypothetical protein ACE5I5_10730 [Candidatus Heimdallarchaeota archaeon]